MKSRESREEIISRLDLSGHHITQTCRFTGVRYERVKCVIDYYDENLIQKTRLLGKRWNLIAHHIPDKNSSFNNEQIHSFIYEKRYFIIRTRIEYKCDGFTIFLRAIYKIIPPFPSNPVRILKFSLYIIGRKKTKQQIKNENKNMCG